MLDEEKSYRFRIDRITSTGSCRMSNAFIGTADEAAKYAYSEMRARFVKRIEVWLEDPIPTQTNPVYVITPYKIEQFERLLRTKPGVYFEEPCEECGEKADYVWSDWFEDPPKFLCKQCAKKYCGVNAINKCSHCGKEIPNVYSSEEDAFCSEECFIAFHGFTAAKEFKPPKEDDRLPLCTINCKWY